MDEASLREKLRKIEALHAGTTSDGEREAARRAADRIKERLAEARSAEPDEEHVLSVLDPWQRMLFVALCRRYGLRPFRRPRQRHSTVQVVAPKTFVDDTLWPEFVACGLPGTATACAPRSIVIPPPSSRGHGHRLRQQTALAQSETPERRAAREHSGVVGRGTCR